MSTNNSVPEQIHDTSGLRHDVLQKIFPTSWASEYPGKPRLSRRERRNREQRRVIARKVAEVFDADTKRRRTDHAAKLWSAAIGEIFSDGVKRPPADLRKVGEFNTRHQQARLKIEDLNAKVAQLGVDVADLRLQFIRLGLKSNDGKRKGADERGVTFGTACTDNLDDPSLQVVDDGKNLFGRVDTENLFDHNSSPSVADAGAHSVGDGPGAGDASATPATEVTLDEPFIDARYDRPNNCIILSCDGSDFAALDRDTGFLAIDRIERALQVQAKLGGAA